MPRPVLIESSDLLCRLSFVFRDVGFEPASMAVLSERTGLKRASLYHRFPGGKEQMAAEVLAHAYAWLDKNVLGPLRSDLPPAERIDVMVSRLAEFYEDGSRACLLNMLSSPIERDGPFAGPIRQTFEVWIDAIAVCVEQNGVSKEESRRRATTAVAAVQGALVLSRGLGRTDPFRDMLIDLPEMLLGRSR